MTLIKSILKSLYEFCDTTTIHGLIYISIAKNLVVKFAWFLLVLTGFIVASVVIVEQLVSWSENPIITTVQIKPISKVKFPEVTVCPPAGSNTALNYDIMKEHWLDLVAATRATSLKL